MTQTTSPTKPEPLVISRTFQAPKALVFKAWSSADHMKRWFSPADYTVPQAEVDFRPGGVCAICMRSPDGHDFWSKGHYVEIQPHERLVFTISFVVGDAAKFSAHTTVTFQDDGAGTRMTVRQAYEVFDTAFMMSIEGAPEGWRTTLDKLEQEVARIQASEARCVAHATFTVERTYEASPAQVFHALTDKSAKARWFGGGDGYTTVTREMDVRPGGREYVKGQWDGGRVSTFDAFYFDVIPNQRLVYAYEMQLNDQKISVSLATVTLSADGPGTRIVITEQGTFLDGYDDAGAREHGTRFLLDQLGASL